MLKVLIDTREQRPFAFNGKGYEEVITERASLPTGDYSLSGLSDVVAVERKSLDDLALCLCRDRERFERELVRGRGLDAFAVVVEASFADLAAGKYKCRLNPHAACQSVLAFSSRLGVPFLFASTRKGAEYVTHGFLKQYLEGARKRLEAIAQATGKDPKGGVEW